MSTDQQHAVRVTLLGLVVTLAVMVVVAVGSAVGAALVGGFTGLYVLALVPLAGIAVLALVLWLVARGSPRLAGPAGWVAGLGCGSLAVGALLALLPHLTRSGGLTDDELVAAVAFALAAVLYAVPAGLHLHGVLARRS